MSIQDQIAPYLNRFVLLFNQNATAKLEIGCNDGKVSVNISHDWGAVVQMAPAQKPVNQLYSAALKKTVRPSQLNRLKKRADARAGQAKVSTQKHEETAEKAIEEISKALQEAEKVKHEAENAKQEADIAQTKAVKAKAELDNLEERFKEKKCEYCDFTFYLVTDMTDHINKVHNYPCSICSWCPKTHKILQDHWENSDDEVFCEFCGHAEYSCQAIFKHIDSKHKKGRFKRYNHPYS